jgi:hypothetical protein
MPRRSRLPRTPGGVRGAESGFLLLDVMVAVLLVSLVMGSMVASVLAAGGRVLHGEAAAEALGGGSPTTLSAGWQWPSAVWNAEWTAAQRLRIDLRDAWSPGLLVGVWLDGWFKGESPVSDQGVVELDLAQLAVMPGEEVAIRARIDGRGWGPRWRTIVPGSAAAGDLVTPTEGSQQVVAIHLPEVATRQPGVGWCDLGALSLLPCLSLAPLPPASSSASVVLGGRRQTWKAEPGRELDIYF